MTSRAFLTALGAGQNEAYASLLRDYGPAPHAYAMVLTRSSDDAADLVQEVVTSVYRHRHEVTGSVHSLRAYLFRAIRNRALNEARNRRTRERCLAPLRAEVPQVPDALAIIVKDEFATAVRRAIAALPPRAREAFTLSRICSLSRAEVAAHLGVTTATVATQLASATRAVRAELRARGLIDAD